MDLTNPILPAVSGAAVKSAASRVYDDLRRRIVNLELPPDATLSRAELARDYEVSQTPIREAMQRLELDDLVRIYPQSRTVVTRIDPERLFEAHFLRVAVESEVVRRLARDPARAPTGRLKTLITMQESLVGNLDEVAMFNELDEAFHRTMFEAAGQPGLYGLVRSRGSHLARARRLDLPKAGKMRTIMGGHRAVVAAIAAGKPDEADAAIRAHLTGTVERIADLRQEFPDYFAA